MDTFSVNEKTFLRRLKDNHDVQKTFSKHFIEAYFLSKQKHITKTS